MKRIEPTINILHRKPGQYKPSFLMVWKPTTIPRLNGAYGLQGRFKDRLPDGSASCPDKK
jgi:hypothetical protein